MWPNKVGLEHPQSLLPGPHDHTLLQAHTWQLQCQALQLREQNMLHLRKREEAAVSLRPHHTQGRGPPWAGPGQPLLWL